MQQVNEYVAIKIKLLLTVIENAEFTDYQGINREFIFYKVHTSLTQTLLLLFHVAQLIVNIVFVRYQTRPGYVSRKSP